jgi:hypothetical protein
MELGALSARTLRGAVATGICDWMFNHATVATCSLSLRNSSRPLAATPRPFLAASALPNIVELAQSVPDLSTLVTAVTAGGLVSILEGPG